MVLRCISRELAAQPTNKRVGHRGRNPGPDFNGYVKSTGDAAACSSEPVGTTVNRADAIDVAEGRAQLQAAFQFRFAFGQPSDELARPDVRCTWGGS
jgi:hypothetical protein